MTLNSDSTTRPIDIRIIAYRFTRILVLILIVFFTLKLTVLDIVAIHTDQMSPTLQSGDYALMFRGAFCKPLSWIVKPSYGSAVIFVNPLDPKSTGCQRLAAQAGDMMAIDSGVASIPDKPQIRFSIEKPCGDLLPPEYAPRDYAPPFYVPSFGQEYQLDTLPIRDFCFVASMVAQENPRKKVSVVPTLYVDGAVSPDYRIKDFPLYQGLLDSVPQRTLYDWFFWDRLGAYLAHCHPNQAIRLSLGLTLNKERLSRYRCKESFIFLLSDHWCGGLDSRYFGPVRLGGVQGQVVCVLWSTRGDRKFPWVNFGRLFRIIR